LLQRELVSPHQLEEALRNQAIFGGRLGSHLVDLGALEEEQLARVLSVRYRVPFVRSHHFEHLPGSLFDLLPPSLAERHLAIPLQKEARQLVVALPDPGDRDALDDIARTCGIRIKPVVAVESTLVRALHRYYGLERIGHYHPDKEDAAIQTGTVAERQTTDWRAPGDNARADDTADAPELTVEVAESLEQLGEQFSRAADRDMVAELVITWIRREYRSGALLLVRRDQALGWYAVRDGDPLPGFGRFQLGLDEPSLLQMVAESHVQYLGPVPRNPFNSLLLHELGGQLPKQVLIEPVLLQGRLIGFLYVDNPRLNLAALSDEVRELSARLAMAFERLILQNKLAST